MLLYQTLVTSCNYSVAHFFSFGGALRARVCAVTRACVCVFVCMLCIRFSACASVYSVYVIRCSFFNEMMI